MTNESNGQKDDLAKVKDSRELPIWNDIWDASHYLNPKNIEAQIYLELVNGAHIRIEDRWNSIIPLLISRIQSIAMNKIEDHSLLDQLVYTVLELFGIMCVTEQYFSDCPTSVYKDKIGDRMKEYALKHPFETEKRVIKNFIHSELDILENEYLFYAVRNIDLSFHQKLKEFGELLLLQKAEKKKFLLHKLEQEAPDIQIELTGNAHEKLRFIYLTRAIDVEFVRSNSGRQLGRFLNLILFDNDTERNNDPQNLGNTLKDMYNIDLNTPRTYANINSRSPLKSKAQVEKQIAQLTEMKVNCISREEIKVLWE